MSTSGSDDSVLLTALRAALLAQGSADEANRRLDRMNGSIDRLANNVASVDRRVQAIDAKLAGDDGEDAGRKAVLSPALALAVAALSPLITLILSRWF